MEKQTNAARRYVIAPPMGTASASHHTRTPRSAPSYFLLRKPTCWSEGDKRSERLSTALWWRRKMTAEQIQQLSQRWQKNKQFCSINKHLNIPSLFCLTRQFIQNIYLFFVVFPLI